jgi:hypothetical protein
MSLIGQRFKNKHLSGDSAKSLNQSKANNKAEELDLGNTDKLFARTHITFRSVLKFYFQWLLLLLMHLIALFWLPIVGNQNLHKSRISYCDPTKKEDKTDSEEYCNNFNENRYLIGLYIFYCIYFYISALQIKAGIPEVMHQAFMMSGYSSLNRNVFGIFMQVPFLFEMRIFIDWTFTRTNLDVF